MTEILRPEPADEGRHTPGAEDLWSESWYFDCVSDDGTIGVYTRLGRLPNQDVAIITAAIVGPGRPAVMIVRDVPLPAIDDDAQRIAVDGLQVEQHCEEPLERFRVVLSGGGETYADESAPLRGEAGESFLDVGFNLVWETAGIPYQWSRSTRYEVPCRVAGTVRVGEDEFEFSGPGQRDHSWGVRDWFAVGWMWSAFHLEDGTHIHAVGIPTMPGYGVGYVQVGDAIEDITSLQMSEDVTADGLVATASMVISPGDLDLQVEPVAFGALRMDSPDGRGTLFPRAMARVRTGDGRIGTGWIEWNRPQPVGT